MSKEFIIQDQLSDYVKKYAGIAFNWMVIGLGGISLALMSQLSIPLPFSPVPITLQSFVISMLAIFLGSRKAPFAVLFFLAQATIGLPVLAGGISNPFWILGLRAGYLIGFVLAAYVTARLLEKYRPQSFLKAWLILSSSEICISLMGCIWLGFFAGFENAVMMGVVPFIPGALIKISAATSVYKIKSSI